MAPTWQNIHESFALNGVSHSREALKEVGYSLIKEGQDFETPIGDFLLDWCSNNAFLEVLTSGSTGTPKKITLDKSHMVNSARATGQYFGLRPEDTALLCLPAHSIAGKMMLVRAMILGLRLDYVMPSVTPMETMDKAYDFCAMVPLQAEKSLKALSRIGTLILGGAPVSFSLEKKLKTIPTKIFETYGMTETITHIAVRQLTPQHDDCFRLLPDIEVAQDDRGCLVIHAPKVSDTEVITNDLVTLSNKNSFTWLGRFDNIINSGGIKLVPEQIESKLSKVLTNRFFVAGIPDDSLGEKLVLVIEGEAENTSLIQTIKEKGILAKYEIPKAVFFHPRFRETKNGKILRGKTLESLER